METDEQLPPFPMDTELEEQQLSSRSEENSTSGATTGANTANTTATTTNTTTTKGTTTATKPITTKSLPDPVGGELDIEPALCILDGVQDDEHVRVTLPIRRLPAILGRTTQQYDTSSDDNYGSKHFVGLGTAKAFSRKQMRIDYRAEKTSTGECGFFQTIDNNESDENNNDENDENVIIGGGFKYIMNGDNKQSTSIKSTNIVKFGKKLSETGFYTVTCLGKNRITVNKERLDQGQTALLESGSTIRIGMLALYFLTPKEPSTVTIEFEDEVQVVKKRKLGIGDVSSAMPAIGGGGGGGGFEIGTGAAVGGGSSNKQRTMQQELDNIPTTELIDLMQTAIDNGIWDRRNQLIGSTVCYRAVVSAGRAFLKKDKDEVSRGEIMDWIADSDRYADWVTSMLTKMEAKSYQASITKALIRAGFTRTSATGRYIKWNIPTKLAEGDDAEDDANSGRRRRRRDSDDHVTEDRGEEGDEEDDDSDEEENEEEEEDDDDDQHNHDDDDDDDEDDSDSDSNRNEVTQDTGNISDGS